jgi:hypothetical protein
MAWPKIELSQNSLSQDERMILTDIERIANRLKYQSELLAASVKKCQDEQTIEGLDIMVAFAFNSAQFTPQYGGGSNSLPEGRYKVVLIDSSQENVEKNGVVTGGYLAFVMTPIEGPLAGQKHTDRLNLHNVNAMVVEIANKQLSAYCAVTGVPNFQDTQQLYNRPFIVDIEVQKDKQGNPHPKGYTEIKALYDINGNTPDKAGSGPGANAAPAAAPTAPAAGVQPSAPAAATPAAWGQPPAAAPAAGAVAIDSNVAPPAAAWGGQAAAAAPVAAWGPPAQ